MKKYPSQFPRAQGDVIKCLILLDQQTKTQRYSVYYNISQAAKKLEMFACSSTYFLSYLLLYQAMHINSVSYVKVK